MEDFESFIKRKIVKHASPDIQRAIRLIKDGKNRLKDIEQLEVEKFPKIVFENIYDAIRDFLLAILLSEGYKTSSHEAPISYLLKKNMDLYTVERLDQFRRKRNGSKYYGEGVSIQEAKDIKEFYLSLKPKIEKVIKEKNIG